MVRRGLWAHRGITVHLVLLTLWTALGAAAQPTRTPRPERGYESRPCGFDLDDDGLIGEPLDDCRICDGLTTDPDGDGVSEDLIYVDANGGNDVTGNGSPAQPYRTIQHAWDSADGPGDGAEDIICLRGTVTTEQRIVPTVSGVPGVRLEPRTGSQARDFELPSNPTMLVGWDDDRDGCYPPYDDGVRDVARCGAGGDVATLNGAGLDQAFIFSNFSTRGVRYLEMAHLTVRDYGFQTASTEDIGFVNFGRGQESSHLYLHDLELDNINRGKELDSSAIVFNFFIGEMRFHWLAVSNIQVRNSGSYFARGTLGNIDVEGPVRFQNIGFKALGCSINVCGASGQKATATGFKIWGVVDGFEVIDSVFDANVPAWLPRRTGPTNGVVADACSQDWTVRNNLFRNWGNTFIVQGADNACGVRATDDVLIEGNEVQVDAEHYSAGVFGVILNNDGIATPQSSIEDVTTLNNVFHSSIGWRACLRSETGNQQAPGAGTIVFSGNTCHGYVAVGGLAQVHLLGRDDNGGPLAFPLPRFRIENNIFTGLRPQDPSMALRFEYQPSLELVLDRNVFDPIANFHWLGTNQTTLPAWRAASARDGASRSCLPSYVNVMTGDLHLLSGGNCARNMGGDLSPYTSMDLDGDPRVAGAELDAGADELTASIFADDFESGDTTAWSQP